MSELAHSAHQGGLAQAKLVYTLVPGQDPIALAAYYPEFADYYPQCELQTKRWLVENVQRDWVCFDVGANVGYYSVLLSRLAVDGQIYAFEPTETIEMLRKNLQHNCVCNAKVLRLALGASPGRQVENIYRIWGGDPERQAYEFETVDTVAAKLSIDRLDCIKIDVDSFDFDVLRGAKDTLERFNPWIVVELNHALAKRNQSANSALEWLVGRGYRKALVTDHENFILRRDGSVENPAATMELRFDRRPLLLSSQFAKDVKIAKLPLDACVTHNAALAEFHSVSDHVDVIAPGPIWSYAAEWPIPAGVQAAGAIVIEAALRVFDGAVGIGLVSKDGSNYCGRELIIAPLGILHTATLVVEDSSQAERLVLRNTDAANTLARVRIVSIEMFTAKPATPKASPLLNPQKKRVSLSECDRVLRGEEVLTSGGEPAADGVDIIPIEELHQAFGFTRAFVPTIEVYRHSLAEFKTEIDEAAIFSYVYEQAKPKRHLEFGTWEGFGAVLCAGSSEAEIWTINLPHGETDAAGNPLYGRNNFDGAYTLAEFAGSAAVATDSGAFIGWRYRAAGYAGRVHQILCDSRDFDASAFSPGFFDSVLIDGGHSSDVVRSDTDKALPLLRSGGIMIWHDFCPDPLTVKLNEAPRGVIRAVVDNFDRWRPSFSRIFWIQPSWILVGLKV